MERITLCGDDCLKCPRYLAQTEEALRRAAELWYRVGWRDHVVSNEEIRCAGCTPEKPCTFQLTECVKQHHVKACYACGAFPCEKIARMLQRSRQTQERCREVCTEGEYQMLQAAFFHKARNLSKL